MQLCPRESSTALPWPDLKAKLITAAITAGGKGLSGVLAAGLFEGVCCRVREGFINVMLNSVSDNPWALIKLSPG